jgi:hypothetical protein
MLQTQTETIADNRELVRLSKRAFWELWKPSEACQ